MTEAQIDALLDANQAAPLTPDNGPGRGLLPVRVPGQPLPVDFNGRPFPCLAARADPGTIYERAALEPLERVYFDAHQRRRARKAAITRLDAAFGSATWWPAAQVRSMMGCFDPATGLYSTDAYAFPAIDPTAISAIRKQIGPPDIPRVDPVSRLMTAVGGSNILNWTVHGADTLAWIASRP